ncbi:MAG: DMT family transporter [Alphaproteobacteria bacterium]|nr:DMT family transporter [Alphaproteobacteria bacterium]MDX5367964.1 DMT family transporter [Alphaproteobacteria bacterium]MDX5462817.1 DMT family transporter [Alphaproteobacteria bacterium]
MTALRKVAGRGGEPSPLWLKASPVVFLLLWSGGFGFAKMGLEHAEPLTLLALRYALVLAVLAPAALLLRPPLPPRRAVWGHLVVVGVLMQTVYFGLCYVAMKLGLSAGGIAMIVSMQPILVAILAPRFTGEVVTLRRWAGLGLGLAGAVLVIGLRGELSASSLAGPAVACIAVFAIAGATLYERRFGVSCHPVTSNAVQYTAGFLTTLPLALALESLHVEWTWELGIALVYLVIGNSLIGLTLLLAMIRRGEAAQVSSLFFLVPPVSALIAWVVIGEVMPPLAWAGLALAAAGVAMAGPVAPRVRRS